MALVKDPDDVLDYSIAWATWLEDDTIATSEWLIAPATDLVQPDDQPDTHTDTAATVWLEGGTLGLTYAVTNRITTTGGRTKDQTIWLVIQNQ